MSQSSEFCRHNPLCCFSTSNTKGKLTFRYRLSPETSGYTFVRNKLTRWQQKPQIQHRLYKIPPLDKILNRFHSPSCLKRGDKTDCSNYRGYHCYQIHIKFYPIFSVKLNSIRRRNYWTSTLWISTNKSTTLQTFCIRQTLEKKCKYNGTIQQLFIHFKKAYGSVSREAL